MKKIIKLKFLKKNKKLKFGKYTGEKLKNVAKDNPGYIVWLFEKTNYLLSNKLYKQCKKEAVLNNTPFEHDEEGELGWEQPF